MSKYFLLFIFCYSIFLFHALYTKHAIYGDGNGYYSYTQSIYFDHQINSSKVLDYLRNFQGRNYIFSRIFCNKSKNPYLVGPALFWLPSMAIMNIFTNNRFDLIHELGPGITGVVLMLSGLYFLEKYLENFFTKESANWTILTIFFGSNVLYYSSFEPALSHQPAFFLISVLLYLSSKNKINFWLFGFLSGLLAITRVADLILVLPILAIIKPKLSNWIHFVISFLIAILPQIFVQYYFYNNIFVNPYLNGTSGNWSLSFYHLLDYLFSWKRGLLTWTPIFAIGAYGLYKFKKYFILSIIFTAFLIHSSWSSYLSAGFGQRFAYSIIPYISIGLCYLFEKFKTNKKIFTFSIFSIWNIVLLLGFYLLKLKNVP